jgi:predicted component of type VI protein secretion system
MKLVIEDEAGTRSIVPFTDDTIVVGRGAEGVTFRLADRNVSRRHARFARQSGAIFVEDLGSLTGTRVNGDRIAARRRLRDGDLVQIGDYDLALLAEDAALAPDEPPPLPAPSRAEVTDVTVKVPVALDPTPPGASAAPAPAAPPRPRRARVLRRAVLVAAVALGVGVAAGWVAGTVTSPAPPDAVTRP